MKNKATHTGHCQMCGRKQKLPNGVIAKHGYVVKGYGYFVGTCPGSGHKPYEQTCELLVSMEPSIVYSVQSQKDKIAELAIEPYSATDCPVVIYERYKGNRVIWTEVREIRHENTYSDGTVRVHYTYEYMQDGAWKALEFYKTGEVLAARYFTDIHVNNVLTPNLKGAQQYLAWCKKKIVDWKLSPLEAVK